MRERLFLCVVFISSCLFSQQKIDTIHFKNSKKLNASFLYTLIQAKPNQIIDTVLYNEDVKKLKRLAGISHASYSIQNGKLTYTLEENHTLIPALNVWSVDGIFSYKIGLYDYNLFGRNITFGGFYQYNGESSFGINLFAPYLFSNQLGLAFNVQKWSSKEPFYFNTEATNYIYNNTGAEAFLTYEHNFKNNFRLGINIGKDKYKYDSGFLNSAVFEDVEINKVIAKFLYEYNNLDFNYQYVSGFKNLLTAQQHFTDSAVQPSYFAWWNDVSFFKRIGSNGNWASRLRLGLSTNSSSVFAPFSVDNNVNIRGVGNIIDRGTGSVVLNTEYRHTLYEKKWFVFQGNAFIDTGSWRQPGGKVTDFFESDNVQLYTGLGFRLMHKKIFNAIFRLDYGYSFENNSGGIVFGIGQYF